MNSLRGRLFVTMLAIFAIAWIVAGACLGMEMTRERSGTWDRGLADIAWEILGSMPGDISKLSGAANLRVPDGAETMSTGKDGQMSFQVWIKPRREVVVRSKSADAAPLKPDFQDGFATRVIGGEPWRTYAISDAQDLVQVQIGKPTSEFNAQTRRWLWIGIGTSFAVLLVLVIAMKVVIRWSLCPVVQVQDAIMSRNALDLAPLPSGNLPEEVRPLVDSFNRLLGRLERAVQGERQFLAEAAHELRTPLAVLLTHAQVAQRSRSLDEARVPLQQLVAGVERSARLSQQLLDSARLDVERRSGEQRPLELADIVTVVTDEYEIMAAHKGQAIVLDAEPCTIVGNVDELGILIGNLIDNAVRYTAHGGRVSVRCQRIGNCAQLQVLDDGPGVAAADRARIFDRFFRVAGTNERGSGIGLSLVARIAQSHAATIETAVGLGGRGFGVTVSFPVFHAAPATGDAAAPADRTVLLPGVAST